MIERTTSVIQGHLLNFFCTEASLQEVLIRMSDRNSC